MRYILDFNIALKWVLAEPDSAKARQLRTEFRKATYELLSPDVFTVEMAHALTRAERQAKITIGDAIILWADIMTTPPRLESSEPLLPRAITISSTMRVGVYDCLYVAMAERENCELVTADTKLLKNLAGRFPFIVSLATLP